MAFKKQHKYVFVVGGVMSGVGKGVTTASIAKILEARGLATTAVKIDCYINVDAGTMNPTVHGEVFVLEDGTETDQDLGNYERFLNTSLSGANYMTTGNVYLSVIEKERNLEYGGRDVEVVPDIPLEVIRRIRRASEIAHADVTVIEIGGTVGEYQNVLFLEAVRMMKSKAPGDVAVVLVSYLPVPGSIGEMKTKPTQYAARTLNSAGVFADVIVARSTVGIDTKRRDKIARFCNVSPEHVISAPDVESIYEVPLNFEKDGLSDKLSAILSLKKGGRARGLSEWKRAVVRARKATRPVRIAVVGKYFHSGDFILSDVYLSVLEAIKFSAAALGCRPEIDHVSSSNIKGRNGVKTLNHYHGVVIPGGFGETGIEEKIQAIEYVRTKKIPYLGLCYGMQLMAVEYARNVLGLKGAHTVEIKKDAKHPIIDIMPDQKKIIENERYGGTMRLGAYPAYLKKGTIARRAYGEEIVEERHRHRYEINPAYVERLEKGGLAFSGISPDGVLMEIAELPHSKHPFFLGTQFHPEFKARPLVPHPLFTAFLKAVISHATAPARPALPGGRGRAA